MKPLTSDQRQYIEDLIASENAVNAAKRSIEDIMKDPNRQKLVDAKVRNEHEINAINAKWKSKGLTFPDPASAKSLAVLDLTAKTILSSITVFDAKISEQEKTIEQEEGFQRAYIAALKPLTLQEIAQAKSEVRNELTKLEEGSRSPVASPTSFFKSLFRSNSGTLSDSSKETVSSKRNSFGK